MFCMHGHEAMLSFEMQPRPIWLMLEDSLGFGCDSVYLLLDFRRLQTHMLEGLLVENAQNQQIDLQQIDSALQRS